MHCQEGGVGCSSKGGTDGGERDEDAVNLGTAHRWGEPGSVRPR